MSIGSITKDGLSKNNLSMWVCDLRIRQIQFCVHNEEIKSTVNVLE